MTKTNKFIKKASTVISLLILLLGNSITAHLRADYSEAQSFYENADEGIQNAIKKISELYESGINVTELKDEINEAIGKLEDSQSAINENDYDASIKLSKEALQISHDVVIGANSIREQKASTIKSLDYDIAVAILEAFMVSVVAYLAWRRIRKSYVTKMLNSKIEVKKDEH